MAFALGIWSGFARANAGDAAKCPATLASGIPARPTSAPGGSDFASQIGSEGSQLREAAVREEILRGNVPRFLRGLKPVELRQRLADGRKVSATICVMPDYLAIGDDRDFLRMPMNLHTATSVANDLGFILPTRKMVDAIYQQSDVRLNPQPMQPGPLMTTTGYFVRHNRSVAQQISSLNAPLGALISGDKKDVVISNRLASRPGQIAIYGWHMPNGKPIQPLSTVHGANYADYSHGIRLVSDTMYVEGESASIRTVLKDPELATLLSDEGPVTALALLAR